MKFLSLKIHILYDMVVLYNSEIMMEIRFFILPLHTPSGIMEKSVQWEKGD